MELPFWYSQLAIDKNGSTPIYVQVADQLAHMIKTGRLKSGERLPSSRTLATFLTLNRQTVVVAYDELLAQGLAESATGKGTFVAQIVPISVPQKLKHDSDQKFKTGSKAGYAFSTAKSDYVPFPHTISRYHLDDGFPDPRIAPLKELSNAVRNQILTKKPYDQLGYGDPAGSPKLRTELAVYLNATRGLSVTADNILITRGTMMGFHLACKGLVEKGDYVALGESTWSGAIKNFDHAEAHSIKIPVDNSGIDVDYLEEICSRYPIRMLYITPHHHYPTTAILRADRRLKLLRLAEKFGFIIFEDDYDFDFHYQSRPLMPLASEDSAGMVLYCGSFTKTISPAFRVGYLVGPSDVINHLTKTRRFIDRQGDVILEGAVANLLSEGLIQRHLRKSLRIYRERRDLFCNLLKDKLGNYVSFDIPEGGMAVWTTFEKSVNLPEVAKKAVEQDLYISDGSQLHMPTQMAGSTRLGFASSNLEELERSVSILQKVITK